MIPVYPDSKKLELSDRADIERITKKFLPYSDFNFTSMWSWDIHSKMSISKLNGNLVVRFTDYVTGKPFYSFLGHNDPNGTVRALINLSKKQNLPPKLSLIPEDSIKGLDSKKFKIEEDIDNFDYVYSTDKLASLLGSEYRNARRLSNRFYDTNENVHTKNLDLNLVENRMKVISLDFRWRANKEFNFNSNNEEKALLRTLNSSEYLSLTNFGVFIGDELVAFTLNEKLNNKYIMSVFAKFDTNYKGAYLYSMKVTADRFLKDGYKYINCEQDLGLSGLRVSKKSLCPITYLKKYTISPRK